MKYMVQFLSDSGEWLDYNDYTDLAEAEGVLSYMLKRGWKARIDHRTSK